MKLIGKKIILRTLKNSDAQSIFININDKKIYNYTDIKPISLLKVLSFIKKINKEFNKKESYQFGIEYLDKKGIIGMIGLAGIDNKNKKAEIEFWLGKNYRGQGVMTESAQLILKFGFRKLRLKRVFAKTLSDNAASVRLLKNVGFYYEGMMRKALFERKKWKDVSIFSMLNTEFKNNKIIKII